MSFSSESLVDYVLNRGDLTEAALVDYGLYGLDGQRWMTLIGVYGSLIKRKGVDALLLHKCHLSYQLDELIAAKMEIGPVQCYEDYKSLGIRASVPPVGGESAAKIEILNDSYCENCRKQTLDGRTEDECEACGRGLCGYCVCKCLQT